MDVEMPDGTTITDVPQGVTKSQLMAKLGKAFNSEPTQNAIQPGSAQAAAMSHPSKFGDTFLTSPEVGPPSNQAQFDQSFKTPLDTKPEMDLPYLDSFKGQQQTRGPALGIATALATGGASAPLSLGKLAVQSLFQGGAGAASEAMNQRAEGVSDLGDVAKEGAMTGAGNFVAPAILKGMGKIANKIFVSPMDAETSKAAQFARDNNVKFPLSSAMPGKSAGNVQAASNLTLPGQLQNMSDAKKVATFLNQNIGTMTQDPNAIKAAADTGQKFLRTVFEPGETIYTQTFKNYRELVGDETAIPLTKSAVAIQEAAQALKDRGANGPIAKRLFEVSGIDDKTAVKNSDTAAKLRGQISDYRANLKILEAKRVVKQTASANSKADAVSKLEAEASRRGFFESESPSPEQVAAEADWRKRYATAKSVSSDAPDKNDVLQAQMDKWEGKITEAKRQLIEKSAPVEKINSLTAKQTDELYTGLLKLAGKDGEARGEMGKVLKALETDLDATGKQYGANFLEDAATMKAQRDQWRELRNVPGLEKLSKEMGTDGGAAGSNAWLDGLFVNPNGKALAKFRELQPDLYHDVADAWLGKEINRFSRNTDGAMGKVLDGRAMRTWYEANADRIKLIFGAPQAQSLDNFTLYAKYMMKAGASADSKVLTGKELATRFLGEAGAITGIPVPGMPIPGVPLIALPTEGAAFLLARGLSDPKSSLFKVMTQGFDPKTRQFMLMTGQLGGREAARGKN